MLPQLTHKQHDTAELGLVFDHVLDFGDGLLFALIIILIILETTRNEISFAQVGIVAHL